MSIFIVVTILTIVSIVIVVTILTIVGIIAKIVIVVSIMIANPTDTVSTIRSQTSYILEDRRDHHGATITVLTLRPVMLVVVMFLVVMR